MKKILVFFFITLSVFVQAQTVPAAPSPARLVNDFAHAMTADQVQELEDKLVAYDDSTSIQIAVVTVESTGDYDIADYALKILRDWKIGNKKTNNGLLILAAVKDHKVYIATGYGMEGAVPDITAKEIVENEITPAFREGNFYRGFDQGADGIIKASQGEYKAPAGYNKGKGKGSGGGNILGFILIVIIIIVFASRGRGGGRGPGGGLMSRSGVLPFIIGDIIGSAGRGGFSGGGGGWSGGGGGGGGGFGGFGGGSGGGGGAGGSW